MRKVLLIAIATVLPLFATTLEQLTMDDIVQKSTSIVRGRAAGCAGELRRGVIFTHCQIAITETWKGSVSGSTDVYIPGGRVNGVTQTFAGMPTLDPSQEYVLFLWAGKSGMNQLIGLTQGIFELKQDGKTTMAVRAATTEQMVDAAGKPVTDQTIRYTASELKKIVSALLGGSRQ